MRTTQLLSSLSAVAFILAGCTVQLNTNTADDPPPPPPPQTKPAPKPAPAKPPRLVGFKGLKFAVNNKGEVELPDPILFETGTAQLKPESDAVLELVQRYLESKPEVTKLRVEGHTDSDNTNAANMQLSKDRANAVSAWLVAKGIDCSRLVPVGFGEERLLVDPEVTPDDKARNRRVVFVNAEVDGKAVGGYPVEGGPKGQKAGDPCN